MMTIKNYIGGPTNTAAERKTYCGCSGAYKVGEKTEDGTIFAGISPRTGQPMYTTPEDAPIQVAQRQGFLKRLFADNSPGRDWYHANEYVEMLAAHGHSDWRLPSKSELSVLFNHQAAIGGFDPESYYWTSSQESIFYTWSQRFSDGAKVDRNIDEKLAVRPVRGPV